LNPDAPANTLIKKVLSDILQMTGD
jgi:hypothetical protein